MMLQRVVALVGLIAVMGSLGWAQEKKPAVKKPSRPATVIPASVQKGLDEHLDVVYAKYGDRELAMDLYRPNSVDAATLPAIVCIHGGGWWQGTRESHTQLAQALAARGYVAATISYRLSGEATFPAAIQDCKAAVRYLRANAERYGINPDKIGATGLSAGGHLAALLGTSGGVAELEGDGGNGSFSSTIQATAPMGAQTNFRSHYANIRHTPPVAAGEKPNLWTQFLGGTPDEVPRQYELASPITHLDPRDPPMIFLTGGLDAESTHADVFRARMEELGIPQSLTVIDDAPHAFLGRQPFFDEAISDIADWFDQYLK